MLTLIGATFHQSALFITVAGFAALIPLGNQIKYRVAPYAFIGFIIFTYISMNVVLTYMEQILSLVGLTKYAGYFSSAKHFVARDFGTGLGVLAKVLFSIYIIWNAKAFIKQNKNYWTLVFTKKISNSLGTGVSCSLGLSFFSHFFFLYYNCCSIYGRYNSS